MKIWIRLLVVTTALFTLSSCSEIVKKTLESNPDLVFAAIKKDPSGFVKVTQEAFENAKRGEEEGKAKLAKEKRENQFKNPLVPENLDQRPVWGGANSPVTIVEYSDLQCPACEYGNRIITDVMKMYEGKVKLVLKHFPIERSTPMPAEERSFLRLLPSRATTRLLASKKKSLPDKEKPMPTKLAPKSSIWNWQKRWVRTWENWPRTLWLRKML